MTFTRTATGTFTVASWSESLVADIDGAGRTAGGTYHPDRGLTRAEVGHTYRGDVEGTGLLTYLIAHKAGAAPVLGFERFEGSIAGHDGTCVFRHVGTQYRTTVSAQVEVVPGMGTGGLEGLTGEAVLEIAGDGYRLTLSYAIE